jgi:hypothetical protein
MNVEGTRDCGAAHWRRSEVRGRVDKILFENFDGAGEEEPAVIGLFWLGCCIDLQLSQVGDGKGSYDVEKFVAIA